MTENQESLEKLKKEINADLNKRANRVVSNHNIVFRQMEAQLILVAGLFLALSTQFSKELSYSSTAVKVISLIIIILLNLSILFGILQHFMEASYFKKIAFGESAIRESLDFEKPESIAGFLAANKQFSSMIGKSVKRWPTYIQMSFLGIAVILIGIVSGLKLFGQ